MCIRCDLRGNRRMLGICRTLAIRIGSTSRSACCIPPLATSYTPAASVSMASRKHVARAAVASIMGVILASQCCASQMTGNFVYYLVVNIHVYNARAAVQALPRSALVWPN